MFSRDKKHNIIIRAISLVLVVVFLFAFLEALTYDHHRAFDGWAYVYETDIDVLIMGSSQAASFDAQYISQQTNTNTVILSSGAQSIKQIYYNLLEVVKYQRPKLIIVEEFSISEDTLAWMEELGLYGLALANLDGMKFSPLKLRSAFSTIGFEGFGVFHIMREAGKTERFIFAAKHLPLQLKRIFKPEERYFSPNKGTILHPPDSSITLEKYEASLNNTVDENFVLPKENIKYMEKVIDLCNKNDITIEFVKTPLIKNASSISGHYAISKHLIENGYDINTYNMMDEEVNVTYAFSDFTDVNHVNESGMRKISDWLSSHINDILNH